MARVLAILAVMVGLLCAGGVLAAPADPTPAASPSAEPTPPGLDIGTPTSELEAKSGLTEQQEWQLTNLLLRLGMYTAPVNLLNKLADESTGRLDRLALIQVRILGILEAVGGHNEVVDIGTKSLEVFKALQSPEVELAMHLVLAEAGHHAARPELKRKHLQAAAALAKGMDTPSGRLARYVIDTFLFAEEYERNPDLPFKTLLAKQDAAWALFESVPVAARVAPFEMLRATEALRIWNLMMIERAVLLDEDHPDVAAVLQRMEKELTFVAQRGIDRTDPELLVGTVQAVLDIVGQMRIHSEFKNAHELLVTFEPILITFDKQMTEAFAQFPMPQEDSAVKRMMARFALEKARLLIAEDAAEGSTKRSKEAIGLLDQAHTLFEKSGDQLATVEVLNEYPPALFLARPPDWQKAAQLTIDAAVEQSRKMSYRPGIVASLANRGEFLALTGKRDEAIKDLTAAVDEIEAYVNEVGGSGRSGERIRALFARTYDLLARLQLEAGKGQDAFTTLERGQAVNTQASLDETRVAPRDPKLREAMKNAVAAREQTRALERELSDQKALPTGRQDPTRISYVSGLLADSKARFFAELNNIRNQDKDYERLLAVRPTNFAAIQKSIPADAALVQIFPSSEKLYLFVVTTDSFKIRTVDVPRAKIDELVKDFRDCIRLYARKPVRPWKWNAPEAADLRRTLLALNALLVAPIEEDIASKSTVAFIPTGNLFYVPMQALARETSGGLEFLVQRKQVSIIAKASDVTQLEGATSEGRGILVAFGNPDGSLAAAQQEVQDLGHLFPQSQVFIGPQATQSQLSGMKGGIAYLHLATHGMLDSRDPNASYMVMAGKEDEGRLRVAEIFELPLEGTRLVTLSACQTALAEKNPGSELSSLAEAFSIAGSPSVVASLWSVEDNSTRELMVAFYTALKSGAPRGKALQQAQLQLQSRAEYAHPFYWAPFVLLGDWR